MQIESQEGWEISLSGRARVIGTSDNSEWVKGIEKGKKMSAQRNKTFVMLDKNKSAEENFAIIKKAVQGE